MGRSAASPAQQHTADAIRRRRNRPCGRQIYLRPSVVDDLRGREYLKPGHLHAACHRGPLRRLPAAEVRGLRLNDVDDAKPTIKRGKLSRFFACVVLPDLRLVVQDHVQQRVTDFQFSVVFDIAQLAKFIHEKTHA